MQQERGETEPLQKEQLTAPMQCPRCGSVDTKFRYYNNGDHAQPRHYCKTCRRYWTVGGSLRDVPIGGSRRNGEQIIVSSSIYSNSPLLSPPSISDEEWQNRSQYPTPMAAEVPQNFDTATIQLFGNLSASDSHSSSYRFDDDISCLAAIQSLIQPQVINESDDAGNHGNGSIDMASWEECNFQSMPPQQPTTQEIPSHGEISQINVQDHEVNAHYLSKDSLIHPLEPMNSFPQDFNNSFRFSTSNANLHNNSTGNTTDLQMARTSVDPNQWSNFPNYGPM